MNTNVSNNAFCDSSGSDIMEDDDILENQHRDVTRREEAEIITENEKRICEKRMRPNSEDTGEEDEFITVGRKRIARSFSKKQSSPNPDECGNEILTQFEDKIVVCVTGKEMLPKQFKMAKLLRAENIVNITNIQYKSPFKILIHFEDKNSAKKLIDCQNFMDKD